MAREWWEPLEMEEEVVDRMDAEEESARVILAAAAIELRIENSHFLCHLLEKDSVYGAAIAIPQIARSAGWPLSLRTLAYRAYIFLILFYILVMTLLYMLLKEQMVLDRFSGQMPLCDFGAFMENCLGGECLGPQGTKYTPARLYDWDQWIARLFVKDSLLALFPDLAGEILEKVDPGEYGLEDFWCRFACCFIFMLTMMEEAHNVLRMITLFVGLPSKSESWIRYTGSIKLGDATEISSLTADSDVKFQVAGIPWRWKVTNSIFLFLPKLMIFKITCQTGTHFLMESSGIDTVIVNAVALAFILDIDNMICANLMNRATTQIMEQLDDYEALEKKTLFLPNGQRYEQSRGGIHLAVLFIPTKLALVLALTLMSLGDYYSRNCYRIEGGSWLGSWHALPQHAPKTLWLNPILLLFPNLVDSDTEDTPYWPMTNSSA